MGIFIKLISLMDHLVGAFASREKAKVQPLWKEQRIHIQSWQESWWDGASNAELRCAVLVIDELLAAEAYWREAVKNCDLRATKDRDYSTMECPWCDVHEENEGEGLAHKPDCPYLLAQEESK